MAKPKPRRRLWRTLAITCAGLVVFLLLFIAAFVFNPFEGTLAELRDIVPRDVNFFLRKEGLADDFDGFPRPKFWSRLADARGFDELANGSLGKSLQQQGLERQLDQLAELVERVQKDSAGLLDPMRDVLGREVIVAGYQQDYSAQPPRPLAEPWFCFYARVSWRVKAALGVMAFGIAQDKARAQGLDITSDGDILVVKGQGMNLPLYVRRHLDVVMVANNKQMLEKAQRLIDGNRDEEPIGQMAAYTEGAQKRIARWAEANDTTTPNVAEFVFEPNAFDGFRRHAATWPNAQDKDSMNERVLASFLNLKGWMQVTGGIMFADDVLALTGHVGLNSKQHTQFQGSFYSAEQQRREQWLDPFLRMVPETACAAAALRMPAGEFLHAMIDALEDGEREFLNDAMRRATYQGKPLNDVRDLIEKLRPAFLPRTGFVFQKNKPDTSTNAKGELMVPVTARSPMPRVAWVFWLKPGMAPLVDDMVKMLMTYYTTFSFRNLYHLKVQSGEIELPEPVTEFTNPHIPGTGEIAMIVFRDFFVLSNSGPLIRDILFAKYPNLTHVRSVRDLPEYEAVERELPAELNGLIWVHGPNLVSVLDDYAAFAENTSEQPDPEWMLTSRGTAEETVRRIRYPTYPSKASMPPNLVAPGGEFDQQVTAYLREQWRRERTNFTVEDKTKMQTLRGMAQLLKAGAVSLELAPTFMRFQVRLMANLR